jgi:hypothetical protein
MSLPTVSLDIASHGEKIARQLESALPALVYVTMY